LAVASSDRISTLFLMKIRLRAAFVSLALLGGFCLSGCSGINASHSVSPASFFLPGLLKIEKAKAAPADARAPLGREVAATDNNR